MNIENSREFVSLASSKLRLGLAICFGSFLYSIELVREILSTISNKNFEIVRIHQFLTSLNVPIVGDMNASYNLEALLFVPPIGIVVLLVVFRQMRSLFLPASSIVALFILIVTALSSLASFPNWFMKPEILILASSSVLFLLAQNTFTTMRLGLSLICLGIAVHRISKNWVLASFLESSYGYVELLPPSNLSRFCVVATSIGIFLPLLFLSTCSKVRVISAVLWILINFFSLQLIGTDRFSLAIFVALLPLFYEVFKAQDCKSSIQVSRYPFVDLAMLFIVGVFVSCLGFWQLWASTRPGPEIGLFYQTSDINNQCRSELTFHGNSPHLQATWTSEQMGAFSACEASYFVELVSTLCSQHSSKFQSISWRFLHSTNGSPFFETFSSPDVCSESERLLAWRYWNNQEFVQIDRNAQIEYPRKNPIFVKTTQSYGIVK